MDQRRNAEEADEIVRKSRQILETKRFRSNRTTNGIRPKVGNYLTTEVSLTKNGQMDLTNNRPADQL